MMAAAFAILAILLLALIYRHLVAPAFFKKGAATAAEGFKSKGKAGKRSERFGAPPASASSSASQSSAETHSRLTKIVFLHMSGCGWCERFRPEWDAFVAQHGADLAARGVAVEDHERSDPRAEAYSAYVSGYPTVLSVDSDGAVAVFKGERTVAGLAEFAAV